VTLGFVGSPGLVEGFFAVGNIVIVETRCIARTSGEGNVYFSRRVYLACKNVCQGIALLLSGIPLHQKGIGIFFYPRHCQRLTGNENDNERFAGLFYFL
jgi:hypothetical protein